MAGLTTSGAPLNDADLQLLSSRQAIGQDAQGAPFGADKRIAAAEHGPAAQPGATGGDQLTNPNLHYGTQWDDGRGGGQADAHVMPHPAAAPEAATPMVDSPSIQPLASAAAAELAGEGTGGWGGDAGGAPAARPGEPTMSTGPLGSSTLEPGVEPGLVSPGEITAAGPTPQGAAAAPAGSPASLIAPQESGLAPGSNSSAPVITSGDGAQASVSLAENTADVATITASDGDAGARLTYAIAGGADAALFSINPETGHLVFKSAPDFERPADVDGDNIYHVTVQVSDGIHTDTQALAVSVTNLQDEAPTGAAMSGGVIGENSAAGTVVGTVTGTDPDAGAVLSYSIVGGDGDTYQIDAATGVVSLKAGARLDFEADAADSITVRVTDQTGLTVDQTFDIKVADVNEAPTGATMSGGVIAENSAAGTVVGTVTGTDADAGDTLSYQIVGGDADTYEIDASTGVVSVKEGAKLDHETDAADSITVRVTDQTGLTVDQTFDIKVADVNEAPTGA
ncbi:cadherin repeat domain-containing protein, partial [Blastochloris sulfoviridis]